MQLSRKFALIMIFLFLAGCDDGASSVVEGDAAFRFGQFDEAREWYMQAAGKGNAGGQFGMGLVCEVRGDLTEALEWYLKAAEQDFFEAQLTVAEYYKNGVRGIARDYEKAIAWYERALANERGAAGKKEYLQWAHESIKDIRQRMQGMGEPGA